jgi:hypothetical protein
MFYGAPVLPGRCPGLAPWRTLGAPVRHPGGVAVYQPRARTAHAVRHYVEAARAGLCGPFSTVSTEAAPAGRTVSVLVEESQLASAPQAESAGRPAWELREGVCLSAGVPRGLELESAAKSQPELTVMFQCS